MENNNEKKLALGEKVYILQGNDDKFSYVEAEVIKVSEREDWTYKPYYLKDRYGKLHIVYYPNSITDDRNYFIESQIKICNCENIEEYDKNDIKLCNLWVGDIKTLRWNEIVYLKWDRN